MELQLAQMKGELGLPTAAAPAAAAGGELPAAGDEPADGEVVPPADAGAAAADPFSLDAGPSAPTSQPGAPS